MKPVQIVQLVLAFLMLVFAIVQINDPDPLLWILIYSLVALVLAFSAFGKRNMVAFWALVVCIVIPMVMLAPGFWHWLIYEPAEDLLYGMSPDRMYIEESREFLGLLIALLAIIPVYRQLRTDQKN